MPLFAVPALTKRAASRVVSRAIVCPCSSSTPEVPPAMTSRRARSAEARCEASVSALTFSSWPRSRSADTSHYRHIATGEQIGEQTWRAVAHGAPTRPRSTRSPATVTIGAARFIVATVASAPVNPTGLPPARRTAATRRVLMAPARTETTTSSVGASVTRSPSTCCFGMPAVLSAASISLPPPCTTTSDACCDSRAIALATPPDPVAARGVHRRASEPGPASSRRARESIQTVRFTAGPSVRRGPA